MPVWLRKFYLKKCADWKRQEQEGSDSNPDDAAQQMKSISEIQSKLSEKK